MSKKSINSKTVRELNANELDQVSGGLYVRGGGVIVKQPIPIKRATGVLNRLIGKL